MNDNHFAALIMGALVIGTLLQLPLARDDIVMKCYVMPENSEVQTQTLSVIVRPSEAFLTGNPDQTMSRWLEANLSAEEIDRLDAELNTAAFDVDVLILKDEYVSGSFVIAVSYNNTIWDDVAVRNVVETECPERLVG